MRFSRRSFLNAGSCLAGSSWASSRLVSASLQSTSEELDQESSFDPWVEIHEQHLRHNVSEIRRRVSNRPVLAVIKNNGYGLGLINAARILEPLPAIEGFAVVKLQEAIRLRANGVSKPILLMGPFDDVNLEHALQNRITPMVYQPIGGLLDRLAANLDRPTGIQICVDTGIGRVGVPYRQAAPLIQDLANREALRIEGIMMTFTEDPEFDPEQLKRFEALCRQLETRGIELGRKHAASTYGLFQQPEAFMDMVRPGMAMYGIYPETEFRNLDIMRLKPALALRARVAYVKRLAKGDSAGYNRAYRAERDTWVATLPVGHADGLPRAAANRARVRIRGRAYPIIASVSASHAILEIGPRPEVEIGDVATLFDWKTGSRPEDFSVSCGVSVYDLTMHLNPLLPRRFV